MEGAMVYLFAMLMGAERAGTATGRPPSESANAAVEMASIAADLSRRAGGGKRVSQRPKYHRLCSPGGRAGGSAPDGPGSRARSRQKGAEIDRGPKENVATNQRKGNACHDMSGLVVIPSAAPVAPPHSPLSASHLYKTRRE